ncbi:hypothetical protein A2397_00725 [Candidatus Amesbacteria bacterium RIFOXYB1_FULL_44_23]|uniref:Uncharacterized protein n=1 Tax=Candidatus Amesbacteria bacterium RIFOXYB1_FULL_44_23 TaxID=1797263 RepID=A0A1F4ZSG8_9BACT|nr:MAG: hypothetical protein A2397_00725 [Candidatus Amesbacteria bacterium RIFOXYB1_FULL_44_23]
MSLLKESPEAARFLFGLKLMKKGMEEKMKDQVEQILDGMNEWADHMDARKVAMRVYCTETGVDLETLEDAYVRLSVGTEGRTAQVIDHDVVDPFLNHLGESGAQSVTEYALKLGYQPDEALEAYHEYYQSKRLNSGASAGNR